MVYHKLIGCVLDKKSQTLDFETRAETQTFRLSILTSTRSTGICRNVKFALPVCAILYCYAHNVQMEGNSQAAVELFKQGFAKGVADILIEIGSRICIDKTYDRTASAPDTRSLLPINFTRNINYLEQNTSVQKCSKCVQVTELCTI